MATVAERRIGAVIGSLVADAAGKSPTLDLFLFLSLPLITFQALFLLFLL